MTSALCGDLEGWSVLLHVCVHAGVYNSLRLEGTLLATIALTTLHLFLPDGLKHNKRI